MVIGDSVGPYRIVAKLGEGGMGEVYRAHDARLGRDVALKVSHAAFSDRFTREARSIASLNHTNICHLYDVGPDHLVMELVEGATLQGPMPFDEALPIINQLIDGIEAAHERNIVHRDLKPANIKITPDGTVKILDFGLAKALVPEGFGSTADLGNSPTMALGASPTLQGTILGTAAYMAPEQARGRDADRRADIWAFGVIVYELLTGKQLFEGETPVEILGQVLHKMPDLSAVPPRARKLLEWCLEKDRRERLQAIGDARRLLRELPAPPTTVSAPASARAIWMGRAGWLMAAFALALAAATAWLGRSNGSLDQPFMHLSIPLPENTAPGFLALSPDGRMLVMLQPGSGLVVRTLDSTAVRPLAGTQAARTPFWSPDSRTIAFFADGALKTVSASGGPSQVVCKETGLGGGGTWSADGVILYADATGTIRRVPAAGGDCADVLKAEPGVWRADLPKFLPDGRHFFYVKRFRDIDSRSGLYVASLDEPGEGQRLLQDPSSVEFVPDTASSSTGHLLFVRERNLMAIAFDAASRQLSGEPFRVAEETTFTSTAPQIAASASTTGTVVFVANGSPLRQLIWFDRSGKEAGRSASTGAGGSAVSLSPDGKSAAFIRGDGQNPSEARMVSFERNQDSRLFTPPVVPAVVWSNDSNRIAFGEIVDGTPGIYSRSLGGGTPELLLRGELQRRINPSDWSRDGRAIIYTDYDAKTLGDIWLLPVAPTGKPIPLVHTTANESQGALSPDGRWLAYYSTEATTTGVYLRRMDGSLHPSDAVLTVSATVAIEPRWRADGKELFYLERIAGTRRLKLLAVPVGDAPANPLGTPRPLFEFATLTIVQQANAYVYSPAADGQRFLVNAYAVDAQPSLDVLVNWPASLKK